MQFLGPTEKGCKTSNLSRVLTLLFRSMNRSGLKLKGSWKFCSFWYAAICHTLTTVWRTVAQMVSKKKKKKKRLGEAMPLTFSGT